MKEFIILLKKEGKLYFTFLVSYFIFAIYSFIFTLMNNLHFK